MAMRRAGSPAGGHPSTGRSTWRGSLPSRGAQALLLAFIWLPLLTPPGAQAASGDDLIRLLERKACPGCRLQDADLVQADLRDADLRNARLQRANLSQSRLDGAVLSGAAI
jgi:uncharacterized protein YjbI with pentapeptide repeats